MNFMFSWQEQYLTRSLRSLVRYCSCHSNIKFISSRHRVISSIYDMIALKHGNEIAQNNMIASFSNVTMFKSVSSLLRMEAFLPKNDLHEEGLDLFRLNDQILCIDGQKLL